MRVGERLPWRITDITDFIMGPQQRPGLNAYASNARVMTTVQAMWAQLLQAVTP